MPDKLSFSTLGAWADRLRPVAEAAGRAILDVRARGFETFIKADTSPVTEADRIAEAIVTAELERLTPGFPIVAEERMADGLVPTFEGS